ncbi:MAG: hypothetical protein WB646_12985 [Steroidobacteraceae bacterium]
MTFSEGDAVGIRCTIQAGPFPDEKLITVETRDGAMSGFVKASNLVSEDEEHSAVMGTVIAVSDDYITVKIAGSFFTTALGMAFVRGNKLTRLAA